MEKLTKSQAVALYRSFSYEAAVGVVDGEIINNQTPASSLLGFINAPKVAWSGKGADKAAEFLRDIATALEQPDEPCTQEAQPIN